MKASACLVLLVLFTACGDKNEIAGAAMSAGLGVAGAGVNRAVTKDCWAQCLNGRVCDHETGMCVERTSCGGRCTKDERCDEAGAVGRCVPLFSPLASHDGGAPDASVH